MNVIPTEIEDVLIVEPSVFGDERGFFFESYNAKRFRDLTGIDVTFVQDNHSMSQKGILRGMHYQIFNAQDKLVRVSSGASLTSQWISEHHRRLWQVGWRRIKRGKQAATFCAKGFCAWLCCAERAGEFLYKASDYYTPEAERYLRWDCSEIGINAH